MYRVSKDLVFTDSQLQYIQRSQRPFWDAELSKERKETSNGIPLHTTHALSTHALSTQVNGSLPRAGKGWQCARQLKENPTLVLTTDPHHHSDDQFEGLSPQIAMHAYRQDIPDAVYKSYNSYFSKCGS
jgi:hypothetical protein